MSCLPPAQSSASQSRRLVAHSLPSPSAGEYLLIHAAAGGVGLAALQIGKALGAKVIAACSTQAKLDVCLKNGADYAVNYAEGAKGDWQKKVMEITKGHGADV